MKNLLFVGLFWFSSACESISTMPQRLSAGQWGGEQFLMTVENSKITFLWGCASGEISENVTLTNGKFSVFGTYKRGAGILPADPALWLQNQPARYEGVLSGKTVLIKATLINGNVDLGSFSVTLGQEATLYFCA